MLHKNAHKAMHAYLSDLTHAQAPCSENNENKTPLANVAQLLEDANAHLLGESQLSSNDSALFNVCVADNASKENLVAVETVDTEYELTHQALHERLPNRFQALFFEVAGIRLAIPLIELGGIVKMQSLNKVPGKPSWFMGLLVAKQMSYQCVDTALWMAPEKYKGLEHKTIEYTHVIQLDKTPWALGCTSLTTTHELEFMDVQWRDQGKKRPWLAGMIKQKMCALIDVNQLIGLLASKPNDKCANGVKL